MLHSFRLRRRKPAQKELPIARQQEPDRNFAQGGRSFYFFDFDDNVAFLSTPAFIFHKRTGEELRLSSREFARHGHDIGQKGPYQDYVIDLDENKGTFRCYRDQQTHFLEKLLFRRSQPFVQDLAAALGYPDLQWKGPSWSCFYHAVFNQRPVGVITARGHHPETLKTGIREFVKSGFLPWEPNYLTLLPVNHSPTQRHLTSGANLPVAELKKAAIRKSVEQALQVHGYNPYHRFGMSDDSPENIRLIIEEMASLKRSYPDLSFFVIETGNGEMVKHEVFTDHTEDSAMSQKEQLSLL